MRSFYKLALFGAFLVTLLIVIDTIDAGKKQHKKRDTVVRYLNTKENGENQRNGKQKHSDNGNKFNPQKFDEYIDQVTKTFKEEKKYKVVENDRPQKVLKTQSQNENEEIEDEIVVPVLKSHSRKKMLSDDDNNKNSFVVKQNHNNENGNSNKNKVNPRITRRYTLAEVEIDDPEFHDDPKREEVEEINAGDCSKEECLWKETEDFIEKYKPNESWKQQTNLRDGYYNQKDHIIDYEKVEETNSVLEALHSQQHKSRSMSDDTNQHYPIERKSPRTLTFTLYEDTVNGQVKERLKIKDDGLGECEVADIIEKLFARGDNNSPQLIPSVFDPDQIVEQACQPFKFNPYPRHLRFIVFDVTLHGEVKKHIFVEEDGITFCELEKLLYRFYELDELQ